MVRLEEYEAKIGMITYSGDEMKDVDEDIEEKGFSYCLLDDREMGYFLRAGYKIEVAEKHHTFDVIYLHCKVTK